VAAPDRPSLHRSSPHHPKPSRPGRTPEAAHALQSQLSALLLGAGAGAAGGVLDPASLCIAPGRAAWAAYLDIYVLSADGSLLDACLLAALGALSDAALPAVRVTRDGNVERAGAGGGGAAAAADAEASAGARRLELRRLPVALTCGLYVPPPDAAAATAEGDAARRAGAGGTPGTAARLVADPNREEEPMMASSITVVVDGSGADASVLAALSSGGGGASAPGAPLLTRCVDAARARHREVAGLLAKAVARSHAAAEAQG